jgi:pimeloyl-ACP methyl ester carboxylesterase
MCSVLLRVVLLSVTMLSIGCASRIPFGNNPATGQLVNLNGINLYFETYGAGEPLVLLHGNGDSIAGMATLIDHFSQQYRVIAVDSRGHGKSSPGQEPLTYDLMADDVAALLEHLGTGPVKLLGWSDGGNIGLILALRHP